MVKSYVYFNLIKKLFINKTYGGRPIDIEYWNDIHTLENKGSQIDIYIPSK